MCFKADFNDRKRISVGNVVLGLPKMWVHMAENAKLMVVKWADGIMRIMVEKNQRGWDGGQCSVEYKSIERTESKMHNLTHLCNILK